MAMTTPTTITDEICQFCKALVQQTDPVWVNVEPSEAASADNCFDNVATLVNNHDGKKLIGWLIWEWPGILLEAVFHAVWEDNEGNLIDPTPQKDGECRILFLPDYTATDDGSVVPSRHQPLCDWNEVADYIVVCQEYGNAQRRYHPQLGWIPTEVVGPILRRLQRLTEAINRRLSRGRAIDGISTATTISEEDAVKRLSLSSADVDASTALARHLAARGDFQSAFETLIRTAEVDRQTAFDIGETFRQLLEACDDEALVRDFRRRWSMLLY